MNFCGFMRSRHQRCDFEPVVGGADQVSVQLHPLPAATARLPQAADSSSSSQRFLDSLAHPLAESVTEMMSSTSIEPRSLRARQILGYGRGNLQRAAFSDEVAGTESSVGTQPNPTAASEAFVSHGQRGAPLGKAVGRRNLKIDRQRIAILNQYIGRVTELGFFALTLACQQGLGSVLD
jgi:hypothetical protein